MLNWAWAFIKEDGSIEQFECIQCMILESKYQAWLKDKSIKITLMMGTINFDRMTAEKKGNGVSRVFGLVRTQDNVRERPNGQNRHQDGSDLDEDRDKLGLINQKDLEWLAWNWRLMNDQKKFGSRARMVFGHFNRTQGILPTPEQILFGIVLAQVDQLKHDSNTNFKVLAGHVKVW